MRKIVLLTFVALIVVIPSSAASSPATPTEFRSLDGSGNNVAHPEWGQSGRPYLRVAAPNYADGISTMVSGPPARYVSNRIITDGGQNVFSENAISQWGWLWGQFLDHTFGLRDETPGESAPIPFSASDPFEGFVDDFGQIDFARTPAAPGTGVSSPRQEINTVQSYIDGFPVYGGTSARLEWLRQGPVDGNLSNNSASLMLPGGYLPRADARGDASAAPPMDLFGSQVASPAKAVVAGDVRANENIALTAVQTLFAREHNRIVAALPGSLSDEDKFQIARRIVGAEEQFITYNEFLPALGVKLAPYQGYDPNVNTTLSNEFATVGFRGHSTVRGEMEAVASAGTYTQAQLDSFTAHGLTVEQDAAGNVTVVIPLNFAFGNPDLFQALGLGPLLKGLALQFQYRNDELIDDTLRSVLFQIPKPGVDPSLCAELSPDCFNDVSDLGAIDIQRGRDHGMPLYNDLRQAYGLPPKTSFTAITGESTESFPTNDPLVSTTDPLNDPHILDFTQLRDRFGNVVQPGTDAAQNEVVSATRRATLAARLKGIYGSVDNLDSFVGMQSEAHVPGTDFGQLELAVWKKQFRALRDGDRFFYLNDPVLTTINQLYGIDYRHTLAEIIQMNSGVGVPPNVFKFVDPPPAGENTVVLGDARVERQTDNNAAGRAEAFRLIVPADGTLTSLRIYVGRGSNATQVKVGLYGDSSNAPGPLLGEGTLTSPQTAAWNDVSLPPVPISTGSVVWVAVLGVDGTLVFRDRCCGGGGTAPSQASAQTSLTDLPATWTPGTSYLDGPISAFARFAANVAAPLLGTAQVTPQLDSDSAGQAEAFRTTAATDGTVTQLNLYLDPASAATSVIAGVYSDNGGHPGTLLGKGVITSPTPGAWNSVSLPTIALAHGTSYWITLLSPFGAGTVRFEDSCCGGGGSGPSEASMQTALTDLPIIWSPGQAFPTDGPLSAFSTG